MLCYCLETNQYKLKKIVTSSFLYVIRNKKFYLFMLYLVLAASPLASKGFAQRGLIKLIFRIFYLKEK